MRHLGSLAGRTLLVAVIGALSVSVLVGAADAESAADVGTSAQMKHVLVDLGHSLLRFDRATVVRELGSGWVLMEASDAETDLGTLLDDLGVIWEPNRTYDLLADPLFGDQWGLENMGQLGGVPDADVDAPEAWERTMGDSGTVIALIDSGVDLDHPDLIDRIWTNTGEIPGNSIDDDGNGYVDDINGWDILDDDPSPDDESVVSHGTAVAGVAVAASNGVGMVGVAPESVVMPIRACGSSGSCPLSAIVEGIHYAIDNGAQIINLSLGSHSLDIALEDAVAAASAAGVLVVAASGNDGTDNDLWPMYPASFDLPNVISVSATDRFDDLASFAGGGGSNFGAVSVDLASPGKEIITTVIGGWGQGTGTSFAVPMVAGTAALLLSLRPGAAPDQVIAALRGTVDEIPVLEAKTLSGGRLNTYRAVLATEPPMAVASGAPALGWRPLTVSVSGAESTDPGGGPLTWLWSTPTTSFVGSEATIVLSEVGVQEIVLNVTDVFGSTSSDTVVVLVGEDFMDTTSSAFRLDVAWMSALGITKGCNPPDNDRYCPTSTVTREQAAAFLSRALDLPPTSTDYFTDDNDSIFEPDINRLAAAGITRGCDPPDNDRYCPTSTVTRQQMAAFLRRAGS